MNKLKLIPLALIVSYLVKATVHPIGGEDALIVLALALLAAVFEIHDKNVSNSELAKEYKTLKEFCEKEIKAKDTVQEEHARKIDELKTSVASIRLSTGFTNRTAVK